MFFCIFCGSIGAILLELGDFFESISTQISKYIRKALNLLSDRLFCYIRPLLYHRTAIIIHAGCRYFVWFGLRFSVVDTVCRNHSVSAQAGRPHCLRCSVFCSSPVGLGAKRLLHGLGQYDVGLYNHIGQGRYNFYRRRTLPISSRLVDRCNGYDYSWCSNHLHFSPSTSQMPSADSLFDLQCAVYYRPVLPAGVAISPG